MVELREKDTYKLIGRGNTNSEGMYTINHIEPGTYELWVLITAQPIMISGCDDVAPPDETWKMGIKFAENKALTMENAYLSKALLLYESLRSSGFTAQGFYAVFEGVQIISGTENKMDVILICK